MVFGRQEEVSGKFITARPDFLVIPLLHFDSNFIAKALLGGRWKEHICSLGEWAFLY